MLPHPPALRRGDFSTNLIFEGHAIVSADGMIAADDGAVPEALRNDADWQQFQAALDASAVVVLGRLGHRRHPNPGRRRLVLTGGVDGIMPDQHDPGALLFNPAGATLAAALEALGVGQGTVAVTGGTRTFDYFLPLLDRFVLTEAQRVVLPTGRPCFSMGHPRSLLAAAGLRPRHFAVLDAGADVTVTHWER